MKKKHLLGDVCICMKRILHAVLLGFMLMFGSMAAQAEPVFSTGVGTAVTSPDFTANFNVLIDDIDDQSLVNYQEDGLTFNPISSGTIMCQGGDLCRNHIGFEGMFGGIYYNLKEGAIVTTSNNESLSAFEVMVGTGSIGESALHGVWETFMSGMSTGSGTFDVPVGTIVGIMDTAGFDELRIGTYRTSCMNTTFTSEDCDGDSSTVDAVTALDFASAQLLSTATLVTIDIKPNNRTDVNVIDLKKSKNLKVAIVGSTTFNALQVDPATVKFGPSEASPTRFKGQDYNRDGFTDLILTFNLIDTGIVDCTVDSATLTGQTFLYPVTDITGSGFFTVEPCP